MLDLCKINRFALSVSGALDNKIDQKKHNRTKKTKLHKKEKIGQKIQYWTKTDKIGQKRQLNKMRLRK
mgnify:CR=1 FL=1